MKICVVIKKWKLNRLQMKIAYECIKIRNLTIGYRRDF